MRAHHHLLGLAVAVSFTCAAHAEPLVQKNKTPGVVTAWQGQGKDITLSIKAGVDPKDVAEAINASVKGVKAKVTAGKVQVKGKTVDELLAALETVEFGEADLGAIAAAIGGEDVDSGSSLRAKRSADAEKLLADSAVTALGKVVSIGAGKFPETTVVVKILRGPTGAAKDEVRKGANVSFVPKIEKSGDQPDWSKEATQLNAGAWFLRAGDQVVVRVGNKTKGGFEALLIDRQ